MTSNAKRPLLTIGMPVYNGEAFIREALDSLLAQTFTDFVLVISDNCSTDNTVTICKEYAERDQRVLLKQQPENVGAARNFLSILDDSATEYFMWAAADDLWHPKFAEECIKLLNSDHTANFAMSNFKSLSMASRFLNYMPKNTFDFISVLYPSVRVLKYSKKSFLSNKDNMVYSIWRTQFLKKIFFDVTSIIGKDRAIGCGMNDVALLRSHGKLVEKPLFYKRYRRIVPGSWADRAISAAYFLRKKNTKAYRHQDFLSDIELIYKNLCSNEELFFAVMKIQKELNK